MESTTMKRVEYYRSLCVRTICGFIGVGSVIVWVYILGQMVVNREGSYVHYGWCVFNIACSILLCLGVLHENKVYLGVYIWLQRVVIVIYGSIWMFFFGLFLSAVEVIPMSVCSNSIDSNVALLPVFILALFLCAYIGLFEEVETYYEQVTAKLEKNKKRNEDTSTA